MMSMTVTQSPQTVTVEQAAPAQLVLQLHVVKPEQRVRALLEKMQKAARGLPLENQEEVLRAISDWEAIFFKTYQIDSPLDAERKAAAHALLFLRLSHIEYNIIGYAVGLMEKIKWVEFSNDIKKIVVSILPPNSDVEAFIEEDMKKQLEVRLRFKTAQVIKEVMPMIMATFARLEDGLYNSVDRVNQNLQREFEEIKRVLANLNDERTVAIDELHKKLESLTEKIATIYQDLEQQLNETRDIGQKIKIKEAALTHLLNECEAVIKKV